MSKEGVVSGLRGLLEDNVTLTYLGVSDLESWNPTAAYSVFQAVRKNKGLAVVNLRKCSDKFLKSFRDVNSLRDQEIYFITDEHLEK